MRYLLLAAGAALALCAGSARASIVADAAGDWAIGYTGPFDADLDVKSFRVTYDPDALGFNLTGVMQGAIDLATGGFYVVGANTGAGASAPFAPQGAPNVRFDRVILIQKTGDGTVFGPGGGPISGSSADDTFRTFVPLAMLPSTGADSPFDYTFNLWPRSATNLISDFAPDNSMLASVPEPATWVMLIGGFALAGAALRRRRLGVA